MFLEKTYQQEGLVNKYSPASFCTMPTNHYFGLVYFKHQQWTQIFFSFKFKFIDKLLYAYKSTRSYKLYSNCTCIEKLFYFKLEVPNTLPFLYLTYIKVHASYV